MSAKRWEWSKGKVRPKYPRVLGKDTGVKRLPESAESDPNREPNTGRFTKGNTAHRLAVIKRERKGITTLNPASCPAWLRPHVEGGAAYAIALSGRFPDPVLARLIGDVADAHTVYRALLALGAQGDVEALREARAWLREHRTALATLSGLAGESAAVVDDSALFEVTK